MFPQACQSRGTRRHAPLPCGQAIVGGLPVTTAKLLLQEFNQLRRDLNRSCWVFFIIILWEGVIKDYLMFLEKAFPVPDDVQS